MVAAGVGGHVVPTIAVDVANAREAVFVSGVSGRAVSVAQHVAVAAAFNVGGIVELHQTARVNARDLDAFAANVGQVNLTRQFSVAKDHIGRACGVDYDVVYTVFVDVTRVVDFPAGIHIDALADQVGTIVVGDREGGHLWRGWVVNHHIGDGFAEVDLDVFTRAGDRHHLAVGHTVVVHIGRQGPLAVKHERIRCRTFDHQQVVAIGHGGELFWGEDESVGRGIGREVKHLHIGQARGWQ